MDSFTAYLRPSLELIAKISSVVPVWFAMVITDKYMLGIPLLEAPIWRSPRIPPKFTISSSRGGIKSSRHKCDRHSARTSPNSSRGEAEAPVFQSTQLSQPSTLGLFQPDSNDITAPIPQTISGPLVELKSLLLRTSMTTAVTTSTPLGLHDPSLASTVWCETDHFSTAGAAVMLLAAIFLLGILGICLSLYTRKGTRAHRNTKDVGTQFPDPLDWQHLTLEIPAYWEFVPSVVEPLESEKTAQENSKKLQTPARCSDCEKPLIELREDSGIKEKKSDDTSAEVPVIGGEEEELTRGGDQLAGDVGKKEGKEDRKEETIQDGKIEDAGIDVDVVGRTEGNCGQGRDQLRSETGDREDKEEWEDGGKGTASNAGGDGSDECQVVGGELQKKKKKRRVRGNAKQRASKRAEMAKSSDATGEETAKSSSATGERASTDLLEDEKQRGYEEGKESGMSQAKGKDKASVEHRETADKEGTYSLKETDLQEATFVAMNPAKQPSLPPRPPTPQSKVNSAPPNLPPRPEFTKLPLPKDNGTPQSTPTTAKKPRLSLTLRAPSGKGPAQPKREVPPLLPHHQSYGVAQSRPYVGNQPSRVPVASPYPGSSSHSGGNNGSSGSPFFGVPPPNGSMYHFGGDRGGPGQ